MSVTQARWCPQTWNEEQRLCTRRSPCRILGTFVSIVSSKPHKTAVSIPIFIRGNLRPREGEWHSQRHTVLQQRWIQTGKLWTQTLASQGMLASTHQGSRAAWAMDPGPGGKSEPLTTSQPAPPHCSHKGAAAPQPWPASLSSGSLTSPQSPGKAARPGTGSIWSSIYIEFFKNYNWVPTLKNQETSYPNLGF